MKRLLLLRHAKSGWDNPKLSDYDRPLTARGEHEAPLVGKELKRRGTLPDLILSSSAVRARQTIERVIRAGKLSNKPEFRDSLYGASSDELLVQVQALPESISCLLFCGHNPGLENLLCRLTGTIQNMTTACLACIDLESASWEEIAEESGNLKWVFTGKELDGVTY